MYKKSVVQTIYKKFQSLLIKKHLSSAIDELLHPLPSIISPYRVFIYNSIGVRSCPSYGD
jgi:hypothetical protein